MAIRSPPAAAESACEVKFGQVGIAQLRVRDDNPDAIFRELSDKVSAAPQLFSRAAVCLDLSALTPVPDREQLAALLAAVSRAGLLPVALSYGTPQIAALALALGLPVLAKFRAAYERAATSQTGATIESGMSDYLPAELSTRAGTGQPAAAPADADDAPASVPLAAVAIPAMRQVQPVRSGQRVYARARDLVVLAAVGAGAEVIADGSVHIYAPLRGRALAGAQGDATARIYCSDFQAELVAIAGQYKVFEEIPAEFRGKPVQIALDGQQIVLSRL